MMNKRDFIKTLLFGFIGLFAIPSLVKGNSRFLNLPKKFKLPPLPFSYDALEPYIDRETLIEHHSGYHQMLTNRLNTEVEQEGIDVTTVREMLMNASRYNKSAIASGSGYFNHRIFWKMLSPNGEGQPHGKFANALKENFGSIENFKENFNKAAASLDKEGWVWLINQKGRLKVVTTDEFENPFDTTLSNEKRGFPILCLDLCKHAYSIKYQNDKNEYVNVFWKILNWNTVNLRYNKSIS